MANARKAYDRLIEIRKEVSLIDSISWLLQWDQETGMPARGNPWRAEQLAYLASSAHEKTIAPVVGELLSACEGTDLVSDARAAEAVNVREIRRRYDKKTRLPRRLVEELARTTSLAHAAWIEARRERDFGVFRPWLEKIVTLKREQAEATGYEDSPYDALLDDYEPGEKGSHLKELFSGLRDGLVPLIEKITASPCQPGGSFLERDYPPERQRRFGEMAASSLGFDLSRGRLDEVVHPFCTTVGPEDVRITTRYDRSNFSQAFFGILHEAGHGMYEQGLDPEHFGLPAGEAVSLGIHESQSRMWENLVGRSRAFWVHFLPKLEGVFHETPGQVGLDDFVHAVNRVRPSFIRVEADEVTYNLHVIMRFELEMSLISGDITAGEVPTAWNELFKDYLGLEVPDDSNGCLQDTHWSLGLFGYFPTYCLGNLYSAQFFAAARREIPDLEAEFAAGRFDHLLTWLRENIHCQGMRYRADELVEKVTGESLSMDPLLDYLNSKYSALYKL
ncbi:MAG: carboxypeptidase M32 [Gemmatimonadota bacterium]|nr:carboxypeptidase M32 [Gemmatimonadota bacterium]